MSWDFQTEPEFQEKLNWIDTFVREEVEPLDVLFRASGAPFDRKNALYKRITDPLKAEVKKRGLWACHLGPELGGKGFGQLKLALMNEILGRSTWAPNVFGCAAPDTGNAEILAHYGTPEQKKKYLQPLLDGDICSCFSMTEPQAGSDPREFKCRAIQDGKDWVIQGYKYFSSHADFAEIVIAMVITDPDVPVHQGASMILIPSDTPGIKFLRKPGLPGEPLGEGHHPLVHYDNVRVPAENILGGPGQGFAISQTRLGGGRIHHAMRTVAQCKKALEMMCERALSRRTQGEILAKKQMVQDMIAQSFIQLEQFRLLVLYTAWHIDQGHRDAARTYIAAVKVETEKVMHDIVYRALHIHGALGCSNEMPLAGMWMAVPVMGIADGPTEVHKVTVAKQVLKEHKPHPDLWPNDFLPARLAAAKKKYADLLGDDAAKL
jgi:acyl-CoA dehydrogenase